MIEIQNDFKLLKYMEQQIFVCENYENMGFTNYYWVLRFDKS